MSYEENNHHSSNCDSYNSGCYHRNFSIRKFEWCPLSFLKIVDGIGFIHCYPNNLDPNKL